MRLRIALASVSSLLIACTAEPQPEIACNGAAALCDRSLKDVVLAGSHNAMATTYDGFAVPNQTLGIVDQLELGVRAFLIDTYEDDDGELMLCHSSCAIGSIPLDFQLTLIREWLDAHPHEVIEFLVEDYITPTQFAGAFEGAGLRATTTVDRTLRALIDDGARVVVVSQNAQPPPDWYHSMYGALFVDTPYDFASIEELTADESCALNRGADENPLLLVNHWVAAPLPAVTISEQANAHDVLIERARRCAAARGHAKPHVVATDFVDVGDLIAVVAELNE